MPSLEEVMPYTRQDVEAARLGARRHMLEQQSVGRSMSDLKGDPNWVKYADHIVAIAITHENRVREMQARILSAPFMDHKEYSTLRLSLTKEDASAKAYRRAVELIDQLINTGESAAQHLAAQLASEIGNT